MNKQPIKFKFTPWQKIFRKSFNTSTNTAKQIKKLSELIKMDQEKQLKLKQLGVNYKFETYLDLINK